MRCGWRFEKALENSYTIKSRAVATRTGESVGYFNVTRYEMVHKEQCSLESRSIWNQKSPT